MLSEKGKPRFKNLNSLIDSLGLELHVMVKSQERNDKCDLSFKGVDSHSLLSNFKGIAVSVGSDCTSDSSDLSYVIRALPHDSNHPSAIIRLSIGRFTSEEDIKKAAFEIISVVKSLREKGLKGGSCSCQPPKIKEFK